MTIQSIRYSNEEEKKKREVNQSTEKERLFAIFRDKNLS